MRWTLILAASAVIGSVLGFEFTTPPEGRMDDDGKYITSNAPYTYVLGSLMEIEWTYTPVMDGLVFTLELYYKDNSIGSFAKAGTLFTEEACEEDDCVLTESWTIDRGISTDPDAMYYLSLRNPELKPVNSDLFKITESKSSTASTTKKPTPTPAPPKSTTILPGASTTTSEQESETPPPSADDGQDDTTGGDRTIDTGSETDTSNEDTSPPPNGSSDSATGSDSSLDTTHPDSEPTSSAKKSISGGAIAGIVIGALAGVAIIAAASWFLVKKRRSEMYVGAAEVEANHKVEMSGDAKAFEMPGATKPMELSAERERGGVYELEGEGGSGERLRG